MYIYVVLVVKIHTRVIDGCMRMITMPLVNKSMCSFAKLF